MSRFPPTSPTALITRVSTAPGSRVAFAKVADVRAAGLDVVPDVIDPTTDDPGDPGHALIVSSVASLADKTVRDRLARAVFQFLPTGS